MANEEANEGEEVREAKRRYVKLAEFGLPESPYDTVRQILRAMGKLGGSGTPLANQQIADTSSLSYRVVSGVNRFLLSTGILNREGNRISLTDRGAKLALALDYNDASETARVWRSLVSDSEFLKRVLGALDIKGGMSRDDFAGHISRTAGAPNEAKYVRGANAVIDVLLEAELIKSEDGDLLRVTPEYRKLGAYEEPEEGEVMEEREKETVRQGRLGLPPRETFQFTIDITVAISPETTSEDIEAVGKRILELRRKVTHGQAAPDVNESR